MTKLEELIAALEKIERPTYALETAVAYVTGYWPDDRIKDVVTTEDGGFTVWFTAGSELPLPPPVLSSLDAAVALVNRVLPDAFWMMSRGRLRIEEPLYGVQLLFGSDEILGEAEGNSLPVTICLATLRSLHQEKNNADK